MLLIFFMLTTKDVGGGAPAVPTPPAEYASVVNAPRLRLGRHQPRRRGRQPHSRLFAAASATRRGAKDGPRPATQAALLDRLQTLLAGQGNVELTINAHPEVKSGDVRRLTVELRATAVPRQDRRTNTPA